MLVLWDIIRDWFVQFVWGGLDSTGELYTGVIGGGEWVDGIGQLPGYYEFYDTQSLTFQIGNINISLGDWLSTTSTIIVLALMCLFFYLMIRYMFRLTSGLIRGH